MTKKRVRNVIPVSNTDYSVLVTGKVDETKGGRLYGRLINSEGKYVDDTSKSITVKPGDNLMVLENRLALRVYDSVASNVKRSNTKGQIVRISEDESRMRKAFGTLTVHDFAWADSTYDNYTGMFKNNFLPFFEGYENEIEISEKIVESFRTQLIEKTINSKNHTKSVMNAEYLANLKLNTCAVIYDAMLTNDQGLPSISFPAFDKRKRWQPEQIKSLNLGVLLRFRQMVEELINDEPKMAMAIAIMESGALRTAESVAVSKDEIIWTEESAIVVVGFQVKSSGLRTEILKTENSYRIVPLDSWGSKIVKHCLCQIEKIDDEGFLNPNDVSRLAKEMLEEAGVTKAEIEQYRRHMDRQPDRDSEGVPIGDLSAYVLRRSRASIWANYCGLSKMEIDNLLGHKVPTKDKLKLNCSEVISYLIKAYRRFSLEDLAVGQVSECIVNLGRGDTKHILVPFQRYVIENNTEDRIHVTVAISPAEPGERIRMLLPHTPLASNRLPQNTKKLRKEGTCIGGVYFDGDR